MNEVRKKSCWTRKDRLKKHLDPLLALSSPLLILTSFPPFLSVAWYVFF